ncbi:sigma-54-dependent Fis family transcriptional regulator [Candidatus Poribacteria bacterium]|nr:sigma-54-dependent Fis family transcriptional regulator [Candidatus Poribacteria bacterium]
MTMRILICDDEPSICFVLRRALERAGFETKSVHSLADAKHALRNDAIDLAFLDILFPDGSGLDELPAIREKFPDIPVIMLTAHGTMRTALESMKRNAFDYITKPFDLASVVSLARRAADSVQESRRRSEEPVRAPLATEGDEIVGNSPEMQAIYKTIGRVAATEVTVLIQGECGTGKELVARALHANGSRADKPFVEVNCAAIPATLLESELFGHVKGAFTNAVATRIGRFEGAKDGTIFLDEIGDLSLELQTKLLRVLQERSFQRLGSNETVVTDARVIAATNRDLDRAVSEGSFREDLLYRLNVVQITLPPLRHRRSDILLLSDYFVRKYAPRYGRDGVSISEDLLSRFESYDWPGNVRELENVIHRAIVMARGPVLSTADAPLVSPGPELESDGAMDLWLRKWTQDYFASGRRGTLHEEVLERIEGHLMTYVLEHTGGNKSRAADYLGINRNTLHAKLKRYGLTGTDDDGED